MTPRASRADVEQLLRDIGQMGRYVYAEQESASTLLRGYLPLPEHARALSPETVLIVGDRGVGKSELFRAIGAEGGVDAILRWAGAPGLEHLGESAWLVGYTATGTEYPAAHVFAQFAAERDAGEVSVVWLGLLLRCLMRSQRLQRTALPPAVGGDRGVLDGPASPAGLFGAVSQNLEPCFTAVDRLDAELSAADKWVFVTYDELDRIGAGNWDALRAILQGLIQFWSAYVRRWSRIRPKIFLRRDLYEREALRGPDVSKLAAQRVELVWTTRNLYALAAKRLVNSSDRLRRYFEPTGLPGEDAGALGWLPTAKAENDYRPFVEHLCGELMGPHRKRGYSFTWIPRHLQDANNRVFPRSIVGFFGAAAEIESVHRKARYPRLLHHTSLRGAVDKVSEKRVDELEKEEFPWLRTVRNQIRAQAQSRRVPMERRDLERLLASIDWDATAETPPERTGRGLLQLLMELGIFYSRGAGQVGERVDVRDLYLKGFGLLRRGGVERPH